MPLLDGSRLRPVDFAKRISDFFALYTDLNSSLLSRLQGDVEVSLFCDAPRYDIELLKPFLPPKLRWGNGCSFFCDSELEEKSFRLEQESADAGGLRHHHALNDARAMRRAWQLLNSAVRKA